MYPEQKTYISVFATKTKKLRVRISEPNQYPYEVTINGNNWKNGVGQSHRERILAKAKFVVENLQKELETAMVNYLEVVDAVRANHIG